MIDEYEYQSNMVQIDTPHDSLVKIENKQNETNKKNNKSIYYHKSIW